MATHGPRKYTEGVDGTDRDALRHEQRREAAQSWPVTGSGLGTDAQAKGALGGILVGGLIGAVVVGAFGFIPMGDVGLAVRLLICAIVGALAGGTAGMLYLGGREPELEGETMDADGRASVGTTLRDPETDEMGRTRSRS